MTTAVDAVAADLRARILDGDPAPGSALREEALTVHYAVARHTVRAALRDLAARRLVVVEPHRGARVAVLDGRALSELFELRTALEVEAVRLLAARTATVPPAVLAAARALDDVCSGDPADPAVRAAADAAHAALHHAVVAAAGSPRITAVHAGLADESRLALVQSRPALPLAELAAGHRRLVAGLLDGGPELVRAHLAGGEQAASAGSSRPRGR